MPSRLGIIPSLLLASAAAAFSFPDYGDLSCRALSVTCDKDGEECDGTICDWLNLVAHRGGFGSMAETKSFITSRLATISKNQTTLEYLRLDPRYLQQITQNYTEAVCDFKPTPTQVRADITRSGIQWRSHLLIAFDLSSGDRGIR